MSDKEQINTLEGQRMRPRSVEASACGKAIIVGEHSVVYGSHAVAMPLKQMRMSVELSPHHDSLGAAEYKLKLGGKEVSDRVSGVIPDALQLLGEKPFSLTIKGHSSLPIGAGLGSSATLCIATLRSICASTGKDLDRNDLAELGNRLEARFHGKPSGLDTAVVAYEECVYFSKRDAITSIASNPQKPFHFALIDSKVRASTLAMIRMAEPFFQGAAGQEHLERFDLAARLVKDSLPSGDYGAVAEAMSECGALLKQAGVVPDSIQDMLDGCLDAGVMAAKTTGAGGGGTILCLLSPENWQGELKNLQNKFQDYPIFPISL